MTLRYIVSGDPVKRGDRVWVGRIDKPRLRYRVVSFEEPRPGRDAYVTVRRDVQDALSREEAMLASALGMHWK